MTPDQIAQAIASALNIAATLLPELERIKAAQSDDIQAAAVRADLTGRANGIADRLRALDG